MGRAGAAAAEAPVPRHGARLCRFRDRARDRRVADRAAVSPARRLSPSSSSWSRPGGRSSASTRSCASSAPTTSNDGDAVDRRDRRSALRRPLRDPRTARVDAEREVVGNRGAAADAAQQPRRRSRRTAGGPRGLRRLGARGALARRTEGNRPRAAGARRRRDPARSVRQARRGLPDDDAVTARADRELAARAALGDVGRVPPARGGGADDVRPDDGRVVDLHRHAGNPPGHVPDVRRRGAEALRRAVPGRPDDPDRRARRHGRGAAARRDAWPVRRSSASRSTRRASSGASRRATSTRRPSRSTTRSRACAQRRRRAVRSRSACSAMRRTSCRSSRGAASTSTSSPTRRRRTIR